MPSMLDRLRDLATVVARSLPRVDELAVLSAADETEAARLLGSVRARLGETISLLAADSERRSARELGAEGLAQRNGFKDGADFLQDLVGTSRSEAAKLIRVGELLEAAESLAPPADDAAPGEPPRKSAKVLRAVGGVWHAPIALALKHGWLTAAQSDALRRALGEPRTPLLSPQWRDAAVDLIEDCWSGHWSPEDLARAARRAHAALDSLAAVAEANARVGLRSFKRYVRASGMVHYDIDLDPESDARFYGPIRTLLSPRFGGPRFRNEAEVARAKKLEGDPRSNEQLQADTMVELVERGAAAAGTELFKTRRPQVTVAVTTADLAKARASQEALRRHHGGDHSRCTGRASSECLGPDTGIAWIDGVDAPITAGDALRLICGGGFTPVLFDETGQALDVGKDQRFFTAKQRRAMAKRDGGCLWPDCPRLPEECEAHHDNPWGEHPDNRTSETRDGVLLCKRHHLLLHNHGARVVRRNSRYWLHWPGREPAVLHSKSGVRGQLRLEGKIA